MAHGDSPRHARKPRKARARKAPAPEVGARPDADRASAPGRGRKAVPIAPAEPVRLQKLLASAGFGSRRDVERFLTEERVTVNGRVAALGDRADPAADDIRFDGERVARDRPTYWMLHKPRGVVTTVRDDAGRRTVVDLLPPNVGRVFPVGRLDRETSGLLLMTNDGDVAHALLHPSLGNEREYRVNVKGALDARAIGRLQRGVSLDEGRTVAAQVQEVRIDAEAGTTSLTLTLVEGKKRQIRRSLLLLGFPVRRLVRVRMGPLHLGRLPAGEARPLSTQEQAALLEHVRRLRAGEAPVKVRRRAAPAAPRAGRTGAAGRAGAQKKARPTGPASRRTRAGGSKRGPKEDATEDGRRSGAGKKKRAGGKATRTTQNAGRRAAKKKGAGKPRKPSARGPQRTASSRKGVKR